MLDVFGMLVLTIPVLLPIVTSLGFDRVCSAVKLVEPGGKCRGRVEPHHVENRLPTVQPVVPPKRVYDVRTSGSLHSLWMRIQLRE